MPPNTVTPLKYKWALQRYFSVKIFKIIIKNSIIPMYTVVNLVSTSLNVFESMCVLCKTKSKKKLTLPEI